MATHLLDSTLETVVDHYSPDLPPIQTVQLGDTLTVHTLSAAGFLERPGQPHETTPMLLEKRRGHTLVGPIAIEGLKAGQMLAIHFDNLVPDAFGFTNAAVNDSPLNQRLGFDATAGIRLVWDIDAATGIATNQLGLSTRIQPFLGVVALSPGAPGEYATRPPRYEGGGNIDCRELTIGSTLYIPANVDRGLLFVGDSHSAQGDGEVSGTAIESGMTTTFTLTMEPNPALPSIHAITPAGRVTFGFDADLNEATAVALSDMMTWLTQLYSITRKEALAMASTTVSMRVTQIANDTWGVHALLPHDAIFKA